MPSMTFEISLTIYPTRRNEPLFPYRPIFPSPASRAFKQHVGSVRMRPAVAHETAFVKGSISVHTECTAAAGLSCRPASGERRITVLLILDDLYRWHPEAWILLGSEEGFLNNKLFHQ